MRRGWTCMAIGALLIACGLATAVYGGESFDAKGLRVTGAARVREGERDVLVLRGEDAEGRRYVITGVPAQEPATGAAWQDVSAVKEYLNGEGVKTLKNVREDTRYLSARQQTQSALVEGLDLSMRERAQLRLWSELLSEVSGRKYTESDLRERYEAAVRELWNELERREGSLQ